MQQSLKTSSVQPLPSITRRLFGFVAVVLAWQTRHRSRCDLRRLDPHLLRDIGLQPMEAVAECSKPFWRA